MRSLRCQLSERSAELGFGVLAGDDVSEERGDVAAVIPAPVVSPLERHPRDRSAESIPTSRRCRRKPYALAKSNSSLRCLSPKAYGRPGFLNIVLS